MSQQKLISLKDLTANINAATPAPADAITYAQVSKILLDSLSSNKHMGDLILYAADMGSTSNTSTQTTVASQYFLNQLSARRADKVVQQANKLWFNSSYGRLNDAPSQNIIISSGTTDGSIPFEVDEAEVPVFMSRFLGLLNIADSFYQCADDDYKDRFDEAVELIIMTPAFQVGRYVLADNTVIEFKFWGSLGKADLFVGNKMYSITVPSELGSKSVQLWNGDVMNELYEFLEDYCGYE